MKKYEWKLKGYGKGIEAEDAVKELERIESVYGQITPDIVVAEAAKPDSVLHPLFEWDNDVAAKRYRTQQARSIINNILVTVVHDGQPKQIGAYEIVMIQDSRQYKNVSVLDAQDIEYIRGEIVKELKAIENKLGLYQDFSNVKQHVSKAIKAASKNNVAA